ncbi:sensor histidine kinase [Paenibacillus thailandensis]|uniref:histidine kinase n=1 Tax=Paenibacillus thailandensis TaxID=393250 RepID=A0ABW5R5F4_9BACL
MIFKSKKRIRPEIRKTLSGAGLARRIWPLGDARLSTKLIVAYLLLTVVPMSLLGLISYRQYMQSIEEQNGEYMPKLLRQAGLGIESRMDELAALPEQLASSEAVMTILRKESEGSRADANRDRFTVNSFLARTYLEGGNPDVLGVFAVSGGRLFASSRTPYAGLDGDRAQWLQELNPELGRHARILLPGDAGLTFGDGEPYVLLVRQLHDADNQRALGTMLIAADLSFMDEAASHLNLTGDAVLRLQTAEGAIVYDSGAARIGTVDPEAARYPTRNGSFVRTDGSEAALVSVSESETYGWLLSYSVPMKALTERTDLIRDVTIALFIGFAAVTTVISIAFALNVTRPLKRLSGLMRETELGRLRRADERELKGAEVGMLARSFNAMVSTIEELIDKNVRIETSQKEAELYALQSQINPHFIYNTLETIGMAVEEGERESAVEMVTLLGRMLRFSVGNRSKFVTVEEELRNVKDYLAIQRFRFEDRLDYAIEEDGASGLDRIFTPKFVLQPIVENAVKHGLEARRRLAVTIRAELIRLPETGEERLVFTVMDNGPGIPEDKLAELRAQLSGGERLKKADSGLGLANVHARIRLMLGTDYGLSLESGTKVALRLPALLGPQPEHRLTGEGDR